MKRFFKEDRRNNYLKTMQFVIAFILVFAIFVQNITANIKIEKQGKTISIKGVLPRKITEVQIQINSSRNYSISSYHQISHLNPMYNQLIQEKEPTSWNIFYPVVDVSLTEKMQGVAIFEKSFNSRYSVNGMFIEEIYQLNSDSMVIDSKQLYNWENNIYLQPADSKMTSFYLAEKIPIVEGKLDKKYILLSEDWSGEIIISLLPEHKEYYKETVKTGNSVKKQDILSLHKITDLSKERLIASLHATIEFTIRCQDKSANSETRNGLNIFYDLDAKTFRRPTWIWAWGPSIKLLLESSKIPELTSIIATDSLIRIAKEIGDVTLKFQERDSSHPAYGIITSRWSENKGTLDLNYGFEQYFSIADAQFLAGWGWIPLYKETGDRRFLDGARLLTETTGKLTKSFDIIPMDYMNRASKWKDYSLNEQGFGTEGINELFKIDPNSKYQAIGDAYMEMLLKIYDTDEGLWNRRYQIDKNETFPTAHNTKAQGWAMEGLLACYELTEKKLYLEKAEKMAEHLINNQLQDGSWSVIFNSKYEKEICEKGTPLWGYLFYKLYHFTKDTKYLNAARKALGWCLNNQYNGLDPFAYGGLVGITRASGVIYRAWFPLECTYASGFFGLAVLEELALQNNKNMPE